MSLLRTDSKITWDGKQWLRCVPGLSKGKKEIFSKFLSSGEINMLLNSSSQFAAETQVMEKTHEAGVCEAQL